MGGVQSRAIKEGHSYGPWFWRRYWPGQGLLIPPPRWDWALGEELVLIKWEGYKVGGTIQSSPCPRAVIVHGHHLLVSSAHWDGRSGVGPPSIADMACQGRGHAEAHSSPEQRAASPWPLPSLPSWSFSSFVSLSACSFSLPTLQLAFQVVMMVSLSRDEARPCSLTIAWFTTRNL